MTFTALLAVKAGEAISTHVVEMNEQDLMPGDTTIAVDDRALSQEILNAALASVSKGNA
jgi:hypothetical protein